MEEKKFAFVARYENDNKGGRNVIMNLIEYNDDEIGTKYEIDKSMAQSKKLKVLKKIL